jgi:hypothetical protein
MDATARRKLVESFLQRCVTYANASIERRQQRGDDEAEIARWVAYRDFTEHAVREVASGDLDSWLEDAED